MAALPHSNPAAAAVSVTVILVVLAARLITRRIPGPLIAVIGAIIVSRAAGLARCSLEGGQSRDWWPTGSALASTTPTRPGCMRTSRPSPDTVQWMVLDSAAIGDIDYTAASALTRVVEELRQRRVRLVITSVLGPVRHQLDRYGISDIVGPGAYYDTPGAALEAYHAARPDADQDCRAGDTAQPPAYQGWVAGLPVTRGARRSCG